MVAGDVKFNWNVCYLQLHLLSYWLICCLQVKGIIWGLRHLNLFYATGLFLYLMKILEKEASGMKCVNYGTMFDIRYLGIIMFLPQTLKYNVYNYFKSLNYFSRRQVNFLFFFAEYVFLILYFLDYQNLRCMKKYLTNTNFYQFH